MPVAYSRSTSRSAGRSSRARARWCRRSLGRLTAANVDPRARGRGGAIKSGERWWVKRRSSRARARWRDVSCVKQVGATSPLRARGRGAAALSMPLSASSAGTGVTVPPDARKPASHEGRRALKVCPPRRLRTGAGLLSSLALGQFSARKSEPRGRFPENVSRENLQLAPAHRSGVLPAVPQDGEYQRRWRGPSRWRGQPEPGRAVRPPELRGPS